MKAQEYNTKVKRMESLLKLLTSKGKLNSRLTTELNNISDEIAEYEEKKFPFKADSLKEMIELRMYQRKLKQKDVADILGTSPSRISEILSGKKRLTIDLAKGLYHKLNIDAELIFSLD